MTISALEIRPILRSCLEEFFRKLKCYGVPVSIDAKLLALEAVTSINISSRKELIAALRSTIVKSESNLMLFDVAFAEAFEAASEAVGDSVSPKSNVLLSEIQHSQGSEQGLEEAIVKAFESADPVEIRAAARLAVNVHFDLASDLSLGINHHYFNTLQQVGLDELTESLTLDPVELRRLKQLFRDQVAAELRRRQMMLGQTSSSVSGGSSKPLEEIDFLYATQAELDRMNAEVKEVARKLQIRLRQRRNQGRRQIDLRATSKAALKTQGIPCELKYENRIKRKPDVAVLADLSGSVATFAKFTLNLLHILSGELSSLRIFGFVDRVDEITDCFVSDFDQSTKLIAAKADIIGPDRHSNYGSVFAGFVDRYIEAVDSRTALIVLGDARNNYHNLGDLEFRKVCTRANRVYWLNPESRDQWDTSDSVISSYSRYVDEVFEVRNLDQLERFVTAL